MRALKDDQSNPTIYKHLPAKYADALVLSGQVRVARMSSFKEGAFPRADSGEGESRAISRGAPEVIRTERATITVIDSVGSSYHDGLVYCTTLSPDGVGLYDDADATVRIADCDAFFRALSTGLAARATPTPRFLGWAAVEYRARELSWTETFEDQPRWRNFASGAFFRKPERYSVEREVRGAWEFFGDDQAFIFEVPALTELVVRIR